MSTYKKVHKSKYYMVVTDFHGTVASNIPNGFLSGHFRTRKEAKDAHKKAGVKTPFAFQVVTQETFK